MRRNLKRLVFFLIVVVVAKAEIYSVNTLGLFRGWANPMTLQYPKPNVPRTTVTVCVSIHDNTTAISFKSHKTGTSIYKYVPKFILHNDFCITVVTKVDGFTVFVNGEYFSHYSDNNFSAVDSVHVNTIGTTKVEFAFNEPAWAMIELNTWKVDFSPNSVEVPMLINSVKDFQPDDSIVIVGLVRESTPMMQIKFDGDKETPVIFKVRLDKLEPRYTMTSMLDKKPYRTETFAGRALNLKTNRIALGFVCEKRGWRIYINGYDFLFYYHHLEYAGIKYIKMFGSTEKDGGWKLVKIVRSFS